MSDKTNYAYPIGYVLTITIGFFNLGYAYSSFSITNKILYDQYIHFGKLTIEDRDVFNRLMTVLIPFGAIFGGYMGGLMAEGGRRSAFIKIALGFIAANLLTTIFNFWALCAGRFLMGLFLGAYVAVIPLTIAEISPAALGGPPGVTGQVQGCLGALLAGLLGMLVPYSSAEGALESRSWRYIFAVPVLVTLVQLFLLLFVYTLETPLCYQYAGDQEGYEKIMNTIYNKYTTVNSLLDEDTNSNRPVEQTAGDFLTSPYRNIFWVAGGLAFFHQGTGISAVTFYCGEIFTKGLQDDGAELAAGYGILETDITAVIAAFIILYISFYIGRKTILQAGQFGMALLLPCLALSTMYEMDTLRLILTVAFVFVFNVSYGGILWLYISEIIGRMGVALSAVVHFSSVLFFGILINVLDSTISATGVYLFFFVLQVISIIFVHLYMIDSKDRTKEERDQFYMPKDTSNGKTKTELMEL